MAKQIVIEAEAVQDWAVQPTDDGRRTAVVFRVKTGTAGFSFPADDFGRFAESVIAEAGNIVRERVAAASNAAAAAPASVTSISIDIHPEDSSSALLAVQSGGLRQLFAVDAVTFLQSCKVYLERRRNSQS